MTKHAIKILLLPNSSINSSFVKTKCWYNYCCLQQVCCEVVLGIREAEINVAEGKKQARILSSEAYKREQINQAQGICLALS